MWWLLGFLVASKSMKILRTHIFCVSVCKFYVYDVRALEARPLRVGVVSYFFLSY